MQMDCFDTHYYRFNRKLLLIIGQWPYQRYADRIKIWVVYFCILGSMAATQVAKAITAEIDFDMCIEFFSDFVTILLLLVRYFLYALNNDKAKGLLDTIKLNWQSLMDNDEHEIFGQIADAGRLFTLYYLMFAYSMLTAVWIFLYSLPLLKYVSPMNGSYPHFVYYPAEYFIDEEKYHYLILTHMSLVVLVLGTTALVTDMFYVVLMYHTIGIFKIACYRLEHAFDSYNVGNKSKSDRSSVCQKTARAVDYYKRAVSFCDTMVDMMEWPNLLSILLVLINITVSLYWAIRSKDEAIKMMIGITFSIGQMVHMLVLAIPAQRITDNSEEVIHKAYSSMWYLAPVKEQSLVLLTMQRGLRPSYMKMGVLYPVTLEHYATEVKASFSYFTVLMSMQ